MAAGTDRDSGDAAAKARQRIAQKLRGVAKALESKPRKQARPQPSPLALFPLRLEYRVIEAERPVVRARFSTESVRAERRSDRIQPRVPGRSPGRTVRHLEFLEERPARRELWWRWFPDDPFAAHGTPPITTAESAALDRFRAAIGPAAWWDVTQPEVRAAFAALAHEIGASRALHVLRVPHGGSAGWESEIGRLAVLPQRVALYALEGEQLTRFGLGERIPHELRLSPAQLRPGGWLVDFPAAVEQGMGMRLREPNQVAAALRADWVVAIGLADPDASAQLETFLIDASANGEIEFLSPGTPTNRVAGRPPVFEREPTDAAAFLARATERERSGSTTVRVDAGRLSVALGLDPRVLEGAPGAQGLEGERARSMARALLPGLTDGLFRSVPQLSGQRKSVLDFLCEHAASRGPFSPVRFGHTPYGILPVTPLERARAPESATVDQRKAFQFCAQVASASIDWLGKEATQLPIVRPDDPLAHEKLDEALRLHPVSLKAVVRNLPAAAALALRCPLVRGPGYDARAYLRQLADRPLDELPNPDERDTQAPLLYRLVRFSREVLERLAAGQGLTAIRRLTKTKPSSSKITANPKAAAPDLANALHTLADTPDHELERLMLEVLDLVDHRADAWFTALATCRLNTLRTAQPRGLRAGWYGFLGRLRLQADNSTDGFIQAPSVAQATTAGVLRAAALRHPGSAFEIDLSSRRARQAVRLLDELRQGATLGQSLGNAAARQLHDKGQDFVLHLLRSAYPLSGDAAPSASRPLDGLAVHDDATLADLQASPLFTDLTQAERARTLDRARQASRQIAEALDGLADLVVSEAAHQLTLGNPSAANAWMQVLSGDPPPHELVFLRTPRDAQGSTYRWSFVREPSVAGFNPRARIEPSLASLASELLTDFGTCRVGVSVPAADGSIVRRTFLLQADLAMEPLDLAIGGESEVRVRARFALWREWRSDPALIVALGSPPTRDVVEQLSAQRPLKLDATVSVNGAPTLEALQRRCAPLVDLLAKSRALRPQDLALASTPGATLGSLDMVSIVRGAALSLVSRCSAIEALLVAVEGALQTSVAAAAAQARQVALERTQSGDDSPSALHALTLLHQRQGELEVALEACSHFALPEALHLFGIEDLIANPTTLEALATRLQEGLARRRLSLASARTNAQAQTTQSLSTWQACIDRLCRALRDAGDGDALAVWPEFARDAALTPQIEASGDVTAAAAGLARLRPRLAVVSALAAHLGGLVGHLARPSPPAPVAGEPAPTRDDLERPPSTHESVFVGAGDVLSRPRLCGVVIDEWSDERPSRRQITGVALHYDAPQSESPKALLLGVPATDNQADWDLHAAADLVRETIRWTKVRSLPASRSSLSRVIAPLFSVVTPVIGTPTRRRLPAGRTRRLVDSVLGSGVVVERLEGVPDIDLLAHALRPSKET